MDRADPLKPNGVVPKGEDIPEALRDAAVQSSQSTAVKPQSRKTLLWGIVLGGVGVTTIALSLGYVWQRSRNPAVLPERVPSQASILSEQPEQPIAASPQSPQSPQSPGSTLAQPSTVLGHLSYQEAQPSTLQAIVPNSSIKLRRSAAASFSAMVRAANADGVALMPISGFRSATDQDYLFFDIKAQQGQVTAQRAAVSAPPGYSEHHTGYAIDIGDGSRSQTNLQLSFEKTGAFQWLRRNAAYYSFEMSFPKNNPQGVSYEPWHWRFVGDRDSLETFYKAHSLNPSAAPPP